MGCQPGTRHGLPASETDATSSLLNKDATEMEPCSCGTTRRLTSRTGLEGKGVLLLPVKAEKCPSLSLGLGKVLGKMANRQPQAPLIVCHHFQMTMEPAREIASVFGADSTYLCPQFCYPMTLPFMIHDGKRTLTRGSCEIALAQRRSCLRAPH